MAEAEFADTRRIRCQVRPKESSTLINIITKTIHTWAPRRHTQYTEEASVKAQCRILSQNKYITIPSVIFTQSRCFIFISFICVLQVHDTPLHLHTCAHTADSSEFVGEPYAGGATVRWKDSLAGEYLGQ